MPLSLLPEAFDKVSDTLFGQTFDQNLDRPIDEVQQFRIGSVSLHGFEASDLLHQVNQQRHTIREYVGGGRTVQSLGHQSGEIRWSGKLVPQKAFRTAQTATTSASFTDPIARATQLNAIERKGEPVDLIFGSLQWKVLVVAFDWDIKHRQEVDYNISIVVIENITSPTAKNYSLSGAVPELDTRAELLKLTKRTGALLDLLGKNEITLIASGNLAAIIRSGDLALIAMAGFIEAETIANVNFDTQLGLIAAANEALRIATIIEATASAIVGEDVFDFDIFGQN